MLIFEILLLVMWGLIGGIIAGQLDAPWYHKTGIVFLWPFIAAYVFLYHLCAVWPHRFY